MCHRVGNYTHLIKISKVYKLNSYALTSSFQYLENIVTSLQRRNN